MKLLTLIALSLISLNVFSAEVGEDQKSPCPYADQGARVAKEKVIDETEAAKKDDQPATATSK